MRIRYGQINCPQDLERGIITHPEVSFTVDSSRFLKRFAAYQWASFAFLLSLMLGSMHGCQVSTSRVTLTSQAPPSTAAPVAISDAQTERIAIDGVVQVPQRLISDAAAGIISGNVAGVIGNNGGRLTAPGETSVVGNNGARLRARQLLALTETNFEGATVTLADGAGRPYRRIKPVKTNADGTFRFENLPSGVTFQILATFTLGGREFRLMGLAGPTPSRDGKSGLHASAKLSLASTVLTQRVLGNGRGTLAPIPFDKFEKSLNALASVLTDQDALMLLQSDQGHALLQLLQTALENHPEIAPQIQQDVAAIVTAIQSAVALPQELETEVPSPVPAVTAIPSSAPSNDATSSDPTAGGSGGGGIVLSAPTGQGTVTVTPGQVIPTQASPSITF